MRKMTNKQKRDLLMIPAMYAIDECNRLKKLEYNVEVKWVDNGLAIVCNEEVGV